MTGLSHVFRKYVNVDFLQFLQCILLNINSSTPFHRKCIIIDWIEKKLEIYKTLAFVTFYLNYSHLKCSNFSIQSKSQPHIIYSARNMWQDNVKYFIFHTSFCMANSRSCVNISFHSVVWYGSYSFDVTKNL